MCDTLVALGNSTIDGSVVFAKNSDRSPNEPLITIRVPRKQYREGEKLKCTYIEVEQAEETYEVLLLKPSWMWGAEMGCNEFGLNIGNEAVFTREKYGENSLLGMDMLRIALERCRTSEEAMEMIVELLTKYGQGGNCGYDKKFTYHNSFLMADKNSAWVLETAGQYWAAEQVRDVRHISNRLSIGRIYDRAHPDLVRHAVDKGWCKSQEDFDFARCYSDPLFTRFSGSQQRQSAGACVLEKEKGRISADTMKTILRSHVAETEGKQFRKHCLKSVCMHGGFLFGDHTTGSYIATLNEKLCTYLITGSSTPCLAVFKPYWMIKGENFSFQESTAGAAVDYWRKREKLHRLVLENRISHLESYLAARDSIEKSVDGMIASLDTDAAGEDRLLEIMNHAAAAEEELVDRTIRSASGKRPKIKGGLYYRHYWKKQTGSLEKAKYTIR
jgi:secernin